MALINTHSSSLLQFHAKVLYNSHNHHYFNTTSSKHSISCNLAFQNCTNSLQFKHDSSDMSIIESGLGSGGSENVVDASLIGRRIKEYTADGCFEEAIRVYDEVISLGFAIERFRFFPCLIKAFGGLGDVVKGREIHGHILKLGFLDDVYVANSLLGMYWKCEAVEDADKLFEKMSMKDVVTWNTMVAGLEHLMDYEGSLTMFRRMISECGMSLNRVACVSALSSSTLLQSLMHGQEIHAHAIKCSLEADEHFISGLIELYMKFGKIALAEHVFQTISTSNDLSRENTVIWNVMISGYISNGCISKAVALFNEMLVFGIKLDSSTFVSILVGCSKGLNFTVGRQIHGLTLRLGLINNVIVETALLDMYFKCGDISGGLNIFRRSRNRNLVMWGAVISNSAQSGSSTEALKLLQIFCLEYGIPDSGILLASLRACGSLACKSKGMELHALTVKMGYDLGVYIGSALVDMYAKCRDIASAEKAFARLKQRDLIAWNALISGYVQNEYAREALNAFRHMQSEDIRPNTVTAASILSVSAHLSVKVHCKEIHGYLIRRGFQFNSLVSNSLISTYAKCGDMKSASTVFALVPEKNEISWNSIILGYGMHGDIEEMLILYNKMKVAGLKPDHVTFTAILSACSHAGRVDEGWKYFSSMIDEYKLEPLLEQYTCMVDLLGRAGHLNQAYDLIIGMPLAPDDRIWGSLLGSCKSYNDEKLAKVVAGHIFNLDPASVGYRVLLANLYKELGESDEMNRVRSEIKEMGLEKKPGCSWIEVKNNTHIFVSGDKSHLQTEDIYATIQNLMMEIRRVDMSIIPMR